MDYIPMDKWIPLEESKTGSILLLVNDGNVNESGGSAWYDFGNGNVNGDVRIVYLR